MTQETNTPKAIPPYLAVGISTAVYGIAERRHIKHNLEVIEDNIHAGVSLVNINMPVKVLCLTEGALTGFTDEIFDLPHKLAADELFIDIPGEETEFLGRLAKMYGTYIIGQCKARWPEIMEDRFFNTLFVIDPNGEVVHKAAKNHIWARERSCMPHDIYDRWTEVFGTGIDAFYPVLKTDDIGNIGTICCSDGEYPEAVRALAFNGAEVVYRPSEAVPMTNSHGPGGSWMVQNRGHAEFNSLYMLCPNTGPVYLSASSKFPAEITGGNSHIVGYRGEILSHSPGAGIVSAVIDIEALRQFRAMNLNSNWLKDLRTELFQEMYSTPIHPKNLWMEQEPLHHKAVDEIYRQNIEKLYERGTWTRPHLKHEGAKLMPDGDGMSAEEWQQVKGMWSCWDE